MATRFGNFKDLSQGKEPITDEEALALIRALGTMIPGGSSIYTLAEGKGPREALMELQDWIPGNAAYQNWLNGREQDWGRNAIDLATVGIPLARPAGKALKKGAEFVERIPKGGKEGFIRNPSFDWNKLTPAQKNATQGAIEEWTRKAKAFDAAPQTVPEYTEFLNDDLNDAAWNVAGPYKFTRKLRGQPNTDIVTQAILPEHTGEAAFLRHSPYVSNYDVVLNAQRVNDEEAALMRAGLMPYFDKEVYDAAGHYNKIFPTVEGSKSDIGKQAKAIILDNLESKFPGYKNVMEGYGPGQKNYVNQHSYQLNAQTGDMDQFIQRQIGYMDNMSFDKAREFYKTHASSADDKIREFQENIEDFAKLPAEERTKASGYINYQKDKLDFWQKFRMELEKAFTERSLNEL